jgi:predicted small secreted protein
MEAELKLFEENPLEFLKKKKGWGVQEFNEFAVQHSSDEDLDPVAKITKSFQDKMAELEKSWEEKLNNKIKEKEEEYSSKDREREIQQFKSGINSFLDQNKDQYEFIHSEGATEEVYNLIYGDIQRQLQEAQEQGVESPDLKVMDIKEAADLIEKYLDDNVSKYLSLNKVKSRFSGNETILGSLMAKSSEQPKTLNSSFSPKSKSVGELSAEERKQQAADLVRSWRQNS